MEATEDQWRRLAETLKARMAELGLTRSGLARNSGRSPMHVANVLNVRKARYRDDSLYDLAAAVGWTPASIANVLSGGAPELVRRRDEQPRDTPTTLDIGDLTPADQAFMQRLADAMRRASRGNDGDE